MKDMIYFSIRNNFIAFPSEICNMTKLEVLDLEISSNLQNIPHCVATLTSLKQILFDMCPEIKAIPFELFNFQI